MPRIYDDICAKCPFYIQSGRKNVMCEGITDDCTVNLLFASEEARNQHRRLFCDNQSNYINCEIYTMLEKKYEE